MASMSPPWVDSIQRAQHGPVALDRHSHHETISSPCSEIRTTGRGAAPKRRSNFGKARAGAAGRFAVDGQVGGDGNRPGDEFFRPAREGRAPVPRPAAGKCMIWHARIEVPESRDKIVVIVIDAGADAGRARSGAAARGDPLRIDRKFETVEGDCRRRQALAGLESSRRSGSMVMESVFETGAEAAIAPR